MAVAVVALGGHFLGGSAHSLDLSIGPWMSRLDEAMLDIEVSAGGFESMAAEGHLWTYFLDVLGRPAIPGRSVKCLP